VEACAFYSTVTQDETGLAGRIVEFLRARKIRFCIIGDQGVNAYAEPLVSLDLDIAVAAPDLERLEELLPVAFKVERFEHSLNVSDPGSALRVQFQTDPRYFDFVERASTRTVLGIDLPVACLEDVFRGKFWAALDATRRPSKRQKDLADIARLLEAHPQLNASTPPEILDRLEKA
jgi:Nucleotidyl transferase AbiEii toxin, Type IV TA system